MPRTNSVGLYRVRLKIAAALNILEMISVAASVTDTKILEKGKAGRHRPFRTLLFGLAARCATMLETIFFYTEAIRASRSLSESELSEMKNLISAKRKEIAQARRLLEKGRLSAAFHMLAEAKGGLSELANKLDVELEQKLA